VLRPLFPSIWFKTAFLARAGTALSLVGLLLAGPADAQVAAPAKAKTTMETPDPAQDPAQNPTLDPAFIDPAMMDPSLAAKRGTAPKPKGAPKLPALNAYQTYPPEATDLRAKRKLQGPARPLASTGIPPLPNAAGQPKPAPRFPPNSAPPPTAAAIPAAVPVKPPPSALGPYDPVGIDVAGLRLNPYAETDGGNDTNPATQPHAKGSTFVKSEVGTTFKSDWSRHSLSGDMHAGYTDYFNIRGTNHPELVFNAAGRIDITRDTQIDLDTKFAYTTQRNTTVSASGQSANTASGTYDYGAGAGFTQRFGRASLALRGSFERNAYDNASLADGSQLALKGTSFDTYELRGRAGYEITPGYVPYLQASIDTRKHDANVDLGGYQRDSTGGALRIGTTIELTRLLSADVNVGYSHRNYQDPRLKSLNGPVAEATLNWQATPLTKVTVKASSTLDETTLSGASGIIASKMSGQVEHALLRNLTLTGLASYQNNHYSCGCRDDQILGGTLGANYLLTREMILRASYGFTRQTSTDPTGRYTDNIFMLGMKLQR